MGSLILYLVHFTQLYAGKKLQGGKLEKEAGAGREEGRPCLNLPSHLPNGLGRAGS